MDRRFVTRTRVLAVCLGCALTAAAAEGQFVRPPGAAPAALDAFVHRTWGVQEGLPQATVRAVLQARDGYLWLGTHAGLARFDGLSFTIFDVANTPSLPSNGIRVLCEDREGALWIGTDAGLARYHRGTFTRHTVSSDPAQREIMAIDEDGAGRLWIAAANGLFRREGDRFVDVWLGGGAYIRAMIVDRRGDVWIGQGWRLVRLHGGDASRPQEYGVNEGLPQGGARALIETRDGTVWFNTWNGPARLVGDRVTIESRSAAPEWAGALFEDRDGTLWAGAGTTLVARDPNRTVRHLPMSTGVESITQDREGHLWFGTSAGAGLHRLAPRRVTAFGPEQGLPCANAAVVSEAPDGTIWIGATCKGLIALRPDGRIEADVTRDGEPALALLVARDGSVWTGSWGQGARRLQDGRVTRYRPEIVPALDARPIGNIVTSFHEDVSGAVWAGTNFGLSRFSDGRWTHYTREHGLVDNFVWALTGDAQGALWIGTAAGLSHFQGGRFTSYAAAEGLAHGTIRTLHVDATQALWIGTFGRGLYRFADGRFTRFTTDEGLFENTILRILEDDRGMLWLSGHRGVTRVSRESLVEVGAGRRQVLDAILLGGADGIANPECVGGVQPAGWKMRDGTLWVPTMSGFVRIDPATLQPNATPPPIVVERVTIDDVPYGGSTPADAPPGRGNLEIVYAGLSFSAPERNQFKYKLEGYDDDWIEAGRRRVAIYTRLPPGAYRFRVIGSNSDGVWNEAGATLALSLRPHWYQRRVTHVLAGLALVALVAGGVRLRLRQLTRRTQILETRVVERTAALAAQREQLAHAHECLNGAHSVLQGTHESMVSMLAQLRLGVIVVADGGAVVLANEVVCDLLGVTADEAQRVSWERLLPLAEDDRAALQALVRTPQPGRRLPVRLATAGRRQHAAEAEVQPGPDAAEKRVIFLHEITAICDVEPLRTPAARASGLYGESTPMHIIHRHIDDVAAVDTTVLIEGETGTGKELVARAIHAASSRRTKPLVAVNCAGLTESLLASQLFGHRRGAFTDAVADQVGLFEAANGGTLFLDEIGDMPMSVQMTLLRVLQEREILRLGDSRPRKIDVRLIAATHRHLEDEVRESRFRQDLFYRICVTRIAVPPLRERREDIPLLAAVFLGDAGVRAGKQLDIGQDAVDALGQYDWPGNVRQLKSAIESAVVRAKEPLLRLSDLPFEVAGLHRPFSGGRTTLKEQQFVLDALRTAGGNRSLAARLLGISRTTLYRRIATLAAESQTKMDELSDR